MPHCEEISATEFFDSRDISMDYNEFHEEVESSASNSSGSVFQSSSVLPELFKKKELSVLIRDLNLSKKVAKILSSRSKDLESHRQ